MKDDIVIVAAARTPVGAFNGAFGNLPAHELGKTAIVEALKRAGVESPRVTEVIMGQILTARRPDPQSMLTPHDGVSTGIPAAMDAWRAGFWPCAAVRICPMMTSVTRGLSTPPRLSASTMAALPSSWAGRLT